MTHEELETANEEISLRIRAAIEERERLDLEIQTLQTARLDNTKEINRLLRDELAELEKEVSK